MSDVNTKVPRHVAIIMDGNGRWATAQGLARTEGHRAGVRAIEPIVERCADSGIESVTFFALSTENFHRPKDEITALMSLMREFFDARMPVLLQNGIRVKILGDVEGLPLVQRTIAHSAERMTAGGMRISMNIAFNYGAQDEIIHAAQALAARVAAGTLQPDAIDKTAFEAELYTAGLPPVDLLIRTSGEQRISNFLLYQLAYAELIFVPELWPDFTPEVLDRALADYARRDRRFGGVQEQVRN